MKKLLITVCAAFASLALMLTGCSGQGKGDVTDGGSVVTGASTSGTVNTAADAEDGKVEITGDFTLTGVTDGVTFSDSVYTITAAGEYTASGKLSEGQLRVEAGEEDEVTLILSGASVSCSTDSPIYVLTAGKFTLKAADGTYNEVLDTRSARVSSSADDEDTEGGGTIYAKCDMTVSGSGSLLVTGGYNNAVHSTKDLKVKNVTLKATAVNNALKGKDSVEITSGQLILVSTGGDGIKTSDSDVSEKGNQRGSISISGGNIVIYAACDGIDAACNAEISGDCSLAVYTDTYSDYSGDVASGSTSEFYVVVGTSYYSSSYKFAVYYYNSDGSGVWVDAEYYTDVSSGRTRYYGLLVKAPGGYESCDIYRFKSDATYSTSTYDAKCAVGTVNSSMNAYLIQSLSSSTMSGDWVNLSTSSGGGPGGSGNSNKSTHSAKGIKAANEIIISGGTVEIYSNDDGLHANNDTTLGSGEKGLGNITFSGGSVTVTCSDDGAHADNVINVNAGYINIVKSYEGIEGNVININGGKVYVYASDDGLNAPSGNATPLINITGGYLDVTTASGDTDGIDSNGSLTVSGGFVLVKGGSSSGQVAGSIDVEKTVTVTGGTVVAFGCICETPSGSSCYTMYASRKSFSSGSYAVKDGDGSTLFEFELPASYSSLWISSEYFSSGSSYKLEKDGSSVLSWKQSSKTVSAS